MPLRNPSHVKSVAQKINFMTRSVRVKTTFIATQEPDWDFLDYAVALEKEWRNALRMSLPLSEVAWLKIFPEAKSVMPTKIKEWESIALEASEKVRTALKIVATKSLEEDKPFWHTAIKYIHPAVKELAIAQKRLRSLRILISYRKTSRVQKWQKIFASAKERNLVEIAQTYGIKIRPAGKTYQALCPIHNEHTPSFTIYPPSRFICFGCGIKGSVIDFIMIMERCSAKEAAQKLQCL